MRKLTQIPPAPKSAHEHSSAQEGLSRAGSGGWTDPRSKKAVHEQEENLGVRTIDIREPKLEKEVEQKSFKKGTGEGVLQAGFHSTLWHGCIPCKYTELIAFPHHLCGHKRML